jgi:hypothetical protein
MRRRRTTSPARRARAKGHVEFGSFDSGLGSFSQTGTLQPGRYVFNGRAGCELSFSQDVGVREDLQCSFNYTYTLRLTT